MTEVKVGQNYGGMVLTEAYAMIELKADGVATIKMAGVTGTGTWTEADEENKIVVTIEGDPMTMTCDGTTIEMDMEGIILVLVGDGNFDTDIRAPNDDHRRECHYDVNPKAVHKRLQFGNDSL